MIKEDYPNDNALLFQVSTKAIIRNPRNQILLLETNTDSYQSQYGPHWELPGGRIKDNSNFEENLLREVEEETGITKLAVGNIFDVSRSTKTFEIGGQPVGLMIITYLCHTDESQIRLSHEHKAFQYFPPNKAADLLKVKFSKTLCSKIAKL